MTQTRLRTVLAATAALLSLAFPAVASAKGGDRDRDRMPDRWERKHRLSVKKNDAGRDGDRDGLRNLAEYRAKTNPARPDSDRDGVLDGDEDRDRDRVDNANEDRERTSPRKKDSDRDGVRDGAEDADRDGLDNHGEDVTGMDPIDPDSDDDGVKDGDEDAGVVESFEDDLLTVRVAGGGSVSGLVTDDTEIECDSEDEHERWDEDEGESDESDDDSRKHELGVVGHRRHGDPSGGAVDEGDVPFDDEHTGSGEYEDESDPGDAVGGEDEDRSKDEKSDDSEDDESWDDYDDETCGVDSLVRGAVVHQAKLKLLGDGPVFTKIELVE